MNHDTRFIVQYRTGRGPLFLKSLRSKDQIQCLDTHLSYSVFPDARKSIVLGCTTGSENNTSGQGLWS